jgi:hypothetical protein
MNDQSNNAGRTAPEPQDEDFTSDQAIENAALAGAAAVQRLVAERNNLRNRLAAQQREIATMRAFNEELRRRLYVIHQRYVEVAKRVVGNLEQFDASLPLWCGASPRPRCPSNSKARATRPKRTLRKPARPKRGLEREAFGHARHEAPSLRNRRNRP